MGIQNYKSKNKQDWAQKKGIMHPGIDPNKYMNLAKIDLTTGEMRGSIRSRKRAAVRHWRQPAILCSGETRTAGCVRSTLMMARSFGKRLSPEWL